MDATESKKDFLHIFTHHRVASNLLMVLIILLGIWALDKLNTQFMPTFTLDIVQVRTIWSGASAEDVESAVTKPLEQELYTLDNLHKISSTSATGISAITLEFDENSNIGIALDDINQRISRFRQLPSDAEAPEVTRIVNYENIARVAITQHDSLFDLRELTYQLRDDLLSRGIAKVDVNGLPEEEISIEISNRQLIAMNKTVSDVAQSIKSASNDTPAGFIGEGDVARQLRGLNQQRSVEGYRQLDIASNEENQKLMLGDVATINRQAREQQTTLTIDDKPAVVLHLRRTENADAIEAAEILEQWLEEIRPRLPKGVELQVYDQSWQLIQERISVLLFNGLGGLLLVIAILFIFLNGRTAFWVSAGIPVSFFATMVMLYLADSSINMISMFGLIMAVGIIVDDAIVVAEHAMSKYNAGHPPAVAAELGARRMLAPVVSSSLTTIAAFMPLMIIGGVMGKIMFEIPLVVICIVAASLFECFLILPAHMRFAFTHSTKKQPSKMRVKLDKIFDDFRDKKFRSFICKAIENRAITLSTAIAVFILAVGLAASDRIGFTFFPSMDAKVLTANISFTAGTPGERVQIFLKDLEQSLDKTDQQFGGNNVTIKILRHGISASAGGTGTRRGEQYGSLFVEIISPDERDFSNAEFIRAWQKNTILPAGLELFAISQRMGGPPGQDIDIRLTGSTPIILKQASEELQNKLRGFPGVSAIEDDLPWGQEQLIYHLNSTGINLGLTVSEIGKQLRAAFDGSLVQIFQDGNDEIEVRVILPKAERDKISDLYRMNIHLPNGQFVPLASVASFESRKGFDALRHSQTHMTVRVSADVDRTINNANRILTELSENFLPELSEKYGVKHFYEGRASSQKETMEDMKFGVLISMALIFIILAWVFKSYVKPLVVMAAIPFGITGAFFGHYIMGIELTILSLFGIVGLSGIVVNDSIILVSVYQELREKGVAIKEAIIEAATLRLRAVFLTSITTIAGLTPLLFEGSIQAQFLIPMAVSITFGLGFATFLVLLVIPILLSYQESVFTHTQKINQSFFVQNKKINP